ncbi:MAG TPA: winged helix-turn-helix domain-containing protein [Acidobacteriota bacterium]|nr:winged helix-turn-helix domain-containing protein [Acidobacteriota bacterium]
MEDLSRYYTLLRDPARRKIIEILGVQEKIGFKELRASLGLGVGTVYYHLDMLSDFITQDKQRKYKLNDRGQALYRILKDGNVPTALEISETFSHRIAKWLFLSPVFAKTAKPLRLLPVSIAILLIGAIGAAYANLDPALFFYFPYSTYSFLGTVILYIFNWIGLFLFAELFTSAIYRRIGNNVQLFTSVGIAAFPLAVYPYIYFALPLIFPNLSLANFNMVMQYVLIVFQVFSLLLFSAAFSFGKGIRLDKSLVISLTALYINIAVLFMLGRFT